MPSSFSKRRVEEMHACVVAVQCAPPEKFLLPGDPPVCVCSVLPQITEIVVERERERGEG